MSFAEEPLPPMLEKVLNEIDGTITRKELKDIFYKQRITSNDVQFYTKYLKERNLITVGKKTVTKEEQHIENVIILTCPECDHTWTYKGNRNRAFCPMCVFKKNKWVQIKIKNTLAK